ncbi:heat shock protein transcriptional repressor HspR [Desulfurobacterium atlanticum]|uniref:MerR family transcriptional regulator, heat shock protein HspR n=1 Tax=Desulfurobacterium atlanticum TaxID=240169 RepID=A0A238XKB7_9BACT|nr:MerR family transcriptional regulator [Desulfurobacterium atlanticum]SNR59377.1 MerR family transcriptional regulator, heat shock protein HspR [Desulfurobacterium atlanticum]
MRDEHTPVYMISVVAQLVGVHPQTLRFYENEGLIKPSRTQGKTRLYSEADLKRVKRIVTLTRERGVNVAGVDLILKMEDDIGRLFEILADLLDETLKKSLMERLESENFSEIDVENFLKILLR